MRTGPAPPATVIVPLTRPRGRPAREPGVAWPLGLSGLRADRGCSHGRGYSARRNASAGHRGPWRGAKKAIQAIARENLLAGVQCGTKTIRDLGFRRWRRTRFQRWLRALVAPLAEADVGVSTGFWCAHRAAGLLVALAQRVEAPDRRPARPGDNPFAWAGSMAMRRRLSSNCAFPRPGVPPSSEDGVLGRAAHRGGPRMASHPAHGRVTGRTSARAFLRLGRRQMVLARLYVPRLWWSALGAQFSIAAGWRRLLRPLSAVPGRRVGTGSTTRFRDVEGSESRHAGPGRASGMRSLVQAPRVGPQPVGSSGNMVVAVVLLASAVPFPGAERRILHLQTA